MTQGGDTSCRLEQIYEMILIHKLTTVNRLMKKAASATALFTLTNFQAGIDKPRLPSLT